MTKSRGVNRSKWVWTEAQLQLLRNQYPNTPTAAIASQIGCAIGPVYRKANALGLQKSAEFLLSPESGRMLKGTVWGAAHRFPKGLTPWNKGTHYTSGGRSAETRFKPGSRPHTWMPLGTYRISGDGALERKVTDLPGANHVRWHPVSRIVWEQSNGPVPAGHIVVFRPGRSSTVLEMITLDAVECITRAEHARRNHPRNKSPELAKLVQLKGAITRQVNRIKRQAREQAA